MDSTGHSEINPVNCGIPRPSETRAWAGLDLLPQADMVFNLHSLLLLLLVGLNKKRKPTSKPTGSNNSFPCMIGWQAQPNHSLMGACLYHEGFGFCIWDFFF